ncbi:MAG: DUF1579 domain-containing protein [Lysobacteraceae bacterium]|nr:MAG: DUF1579 domain-containing protein [Xanthomonadaceae bacterium]
MPLPTLPTAPSDFDFVLGDWSVKHRRLKERLADSDEWIEFDGEMSTRSVLGGFGNIEDNLLKFPEGEFRAVALRSYDAAHRTWSIWWLDGRFPGRIDVPVVGSFAEGVGTFYAEDTFQGKPIRIRFLWSKCSADQLRWEQAFSPDAGATWETNWTMDFFRKA